MSFQFSIQSESKIWREAVISVFILVQSPQEFLPLFSVTAVPLSHLHATRLSGLWRHTLTRVKLRFCCWQPRDDMTEECRALTHNRMRCNVIKHDTTEHSAAESPSRAVELPELTRLRSGLLGERLLFLWSLRLERRPDSWMVRTSGFSGPCLQTKQGHGCSDVTIIAFGNYCSLWSRLFCGFRHTLNNRWFLVKLLFGLARLSNIDTKCGSVIQLIASNGTWVGRAARTISCSHFVPRRSLLVCAFWIKDESRWRTHTVSCIDVSAGKQIHRAWSRRLCCVCVLWLVWQ